MAGWRFRADTGNQPASLRVVALTAVLGAILTACGSGSAAHSPAVPGRSDPLLPSALPRGTVVTSGTRAWEQPLGAQVTNSVQIQHTATAYQVAAATTDGSGYRIVTGRLADGAILGAFDAPIDATWPVFADVGGSLLSFAALGGSDTAANRVVALLPDGQQVWSVSAPSLGASDESALVVDFATSDRVVVRANPLLRNPYRYAPMWVLDAATGAVVWSITEGAIPRWADVADGLIMYAASSTGDTDGPSDQVVVRDLATGTVTTTFDLVDESLPPHVLCGGILSRDRVVACGFQGATERVGTAVLAAADGRVVAEYGLRAPPVLDRGAQVVALPLVSRAIQAIDAQAGDPLWELSANQVEQGDITIKHARAGHFIGDAGNTNIVLHASSGVLELAEVFYFIPDGQAPLGAALAVLDSHIVGFQGQEVAVGTARDNPADVLFIRN